MFNKMLYRFAVAGITLCSLIVLAAGFLIGGLTAGYLIENILKLPVGNQKSLSFWLAMLTVIASGVGSAFLVFFLISNPVENLCEALRGWIRKKTLLKVPNLYSCYNNGVTALVRKADYEYALETTGDSSFKIKLLMISPTFTFGNFVAPPMSEKATGTMSDFHNLVKGAHVVELYANIFVPYTSGLIPKAEQERLYPHIPLAKAEEMIWKGYKRPKQTDN